MIKEVTVNIAFGHETPPGCDPITVLDAYDGCLLSCPYCFQRGDTVWRDRIAVKINIVDILKAELINWQEDDFVCVGSRSDPYMSLEHKYHLTRHCLQTLNDHKVPVVITTKSDTEMILADLSMFARWNNSLKILVGFSNLSHYHGLQTLTDLQPIQTLRVLKRHGVQVKAFITPVLPGITDVEEILEHIDPDIPVYLDKLRIDDHNREPCLEYIRKHYPALESMYAGIANDGVDSYYLELCRNQNIINRCTFTFVDSWE